MKEGEIVTIIGRLPGNLWWEGESADGRIGTFPYNYVEELPPEPEFAEFLGKKGISNLDVIQFLKSDDIKLQNHLSVLIHIIAGDGDFIAQVFHEDFVDLDLLIRDKFPLLPVPGLPAKDAPHEVYKCLIHDYFAYFSIHKMVTPVVLKWLQPIPRTCIAPCPHWKVLVHTTNIITPHEASCSCSASWASTDSTDSRASLGGREWLSVIQGEEYVLCDIDDEENLQLEGNGKKGWSTLRYCEIEWIKGCKDLHYSQLERVIPFSLPSLQCSEDLHINHITMQPLRVSEPYGPHPAEGDVVMLQISMYLWNSIRGYMYQFFDTANHPLYHVMGKNDNSVITELIDHKLRLLRQGEKTMLIQHSSTDPPKEITAFLEGCREFFLCYVIDLRMVRKPDADLPAGLADAPAYGARPAKPPKPAKPLYLQANAMQECHAELEVVPDVVVPDVVAPQAEQCIVQPSAEPTVLPSAELLLEPAVCEDVSVTIVESPPAVEILPSVEPPADEDYSITLPELLASPPAHPLCSRSAPTTPAVPVECAVPPQPAVRSTDHPPEPPRRRTASLRTTLNASTSPRTTSSRETLQRGTTTRRTAASLSVPSKPPKPVRRSEVVQSGRQNKSETGKKPPELPPKPVRNPPPKPQKPQAMTHRASMVKPAKPAKPAQLESYYRRRRAINSPSSDSVTASSYEE
ncbi:hypothetical protein WA577_003510 [Blastocystis sp. JDR]